MRETEKKHSGGIDLEDFRKLGTDVQSMIDSLDWIKYRSEVVWSILRRYDDKTVRDYKRREIAFLRALESVVTAKVEEYGRQRAVVSSVIAGMDAGRAEIMAHIYLEGGCASEFAMETGTGLSDAMELFENGVAEFYAETYKTGRDGV